MRKEKIRETDYQQSERPKTRLAQYFDVFRHNFVELLKLSLLQTVFNMPLIATVVSFWILLKNSTDFGSLMMVFIITSAALFVSMVSSFTGLTGVFYCLKKICYAEGEYASSSFFVGLREDWKKGLLTGLIAGLSIGGGFIGIFFMYFYMSDINASIAGFGIAILAIQALVVLMISYYAIGQIIIYENKFRFVLKNAFIMTLMRFHINLLLFIIYPGIFIALFAIMDVTMYVGVVLLVFLVVVFHLMWVCNILGAFDKFINKENYPDFYRKGLYKEV